MTRIGVLANQTLETESSRVASEKKKQAGKQPATDSRRVSHVGRENSPVRRRAFGTGTDDLVVYTRTPTIPVVHVLVRRETRA